MYYRCGAIQIGSVSGRDGCAARLHESLTHCCTSARNRRRFSKPRNLLWLLASATLKQPFAQELPHWQISFDSQCVNGESRSNDARNSCGSFWRNARCFVNALQGYCVFRVSIGIDVNPLSISRDLISRNYFSKNCLSDNDNIWRNKFRVQHSFVLRTKIVRVLYLFWRMRKYEVLIIIHVEKLIFSEKC